MKMEREMGTRHRRPFPLSWGLSASLRVQLRVPP